MPEKGKTDIFSIFQPFPLGIAVASATSNNDPETLEALVKWKNKGSLSPPTRELTGCTSTCSPMFLACTQEYNQCIDPLYALGYRINLPKDVKRIINQIMKLDSISNKIQFWWYMVKGSEDPHEFDDEGNQLAIKEEGLKRNPKNIFDNRDQDSVERSLLLKAYSNPHYLAACYKFNSDTFEKHQNRKLLVRRGLGIFDPLRKSLAIARYAELLSIYDCEYTNEYSELNKVQR